MYCLYRLYYLTMCNVHLCGVGYASSISVTKGGREGGREGGRVGGREGGREGGGTDHVQCVFVWCGLCIIHQCHKLFFFLLFLQIGGCCPPVQRGGRG